MKEIRKKRWAGVLSLVLAAALCLTAILTAAASADPVGLFNGQPLLKGSYSYASSVNDEATLEVEFYYSDGFFLDGEEGQFADPTVYNEHLATASMALNLQDLEPLFSDIGVEQTVTVEGSTAQKGHTANGVVMGQKEIGENGEILLPVALCFDENENDWCSNMTVGTEGEHEGFAFAAEAVFADIQAYIEDNGLTAAANEGKIKFWISGYSRTGAIANLTARRLVEAYADGQTAATSNAVYAYCFEAPKGGRVSEMALAAEAYASIHNCVNNADVVTLLATEEMGFIRYGVDHYVPGGEAGTVAENRTVWSFVNGQDFAADYVTLADNTAWDTDSAEYKAQRDKMTAQLAAIDSENLTLNDTFTAANLALISYALFGGDLIQPISGVTMTQSQYLRLLLRAVQVWGLYGASEGDMRTAYAVNTSDTADNMVTAQEAMQVILTLFLGKDDADLEGMQAAMANFAERIDSKTMASLYKDMLGNWCGLTQEKRESYAAQMWEIFIEQDGPEGNAVEDYLTAEEKTELRQVWYTALDILLRAVSADKTYTVSNWTESGAMDSTVKTDITEGVGSLSSAKTMVLLGSFLYNSEAVIQAHYSEINLAWLRSYDSLYAGDGKALPTQAVTESTPSQTASRAAADVSVTTAAITPGETPAALAGDCDEDGAVNMKDVLVLRKHLAVMTVEINLINADANGDGAVNMKDVLVLRKRMAGITAVPSAA